MLQLAKLLTNLNDLINLLFRQVPKSIQVVQGTIPILYQHIFGLFLTHPLCQHKYNTERQQKWSFSNLTYPVLQGWYPMQKKKNQMTYRTWCFRTSMPQHGMVTVSFSSTFHSTVVVISRVLVAEVGNAAAATLEDF